MPTYSLINNGDTGLSARTTINELLTDINNGVVGATGAAGTSGTSGTSGSSAPAGLVNGTGADSLKQDNSLTTNPATASGIDSIAIGNNNRSEAQNTISIGKNTRASWPGFGGPASLGAISIGADAYGNWGGIAIGRNSLSDRDLSVAIGPEASSDGSAFRAVAIGSAAKAKNGDVVSIGSSAEATGVNSIAIGGQVLAIPTKATGERSISIGVKGTASGVDSIILGGNSLSSGKGAITIGAGAVSTATGSVAIGATVSANIVDTVSIRALELQTLTSTQSGGLIMYDTSSTQYRLNVSTSGQLKLNNTVVGGGGGLVNGTGADSLKQDNSLTTNPATASAIDGIAIGDGAQALQTNYFGQQQPNAIAIGLNTIAGGWGVCVGSNGTKITNAAHGIAIGSAAISQAIDTNQNNGGSIAIGWKSYASGKRSIYIGANSEGYQGMGNGASGEFSIVLASGNIGALASGTGAINIGGNTLNTNPLTVQPSRATGAWSLVLGYNGQAVKDGAISIGGSGHIGATATYAGGLNSISLGSLAQSYATGSVAIGATVSANIVDTVSMRALELQTLSSTQSGGIIMYDTSSNQYRLNVSTSGELKLNNTVIGGSGFSGTFSTGDGTIATVVNGLITTIV